MISPFTELTISSMTVDELRRNSHLLNNISAEQLLEIFIEKFNSLDFNLSDAWGCIDSHEDELVEAQDALEQAEKDLEIATDRIDSLEDEIAKLNTDIIYFKGLI